MASFVAMFVNDKYDKSDNDEGDNDNEDNIQSQQQNIKIKLWETSPLTRTTIFWRVSLFSDVVRGVNLIMTLTLLSLLRLASWMIVLLVWVSQSFLRTTFLLLSL